MRQGPHVSNYTHMDHALETASSTPICLHRFLMRRVYSPLHSVVDAYKLFGLNQLLLLQAHFLRCVSLEGEDG